ncbi:MAG: LPS export ABC transporter periplasmic protein LptC [Dongiaceae bacterium]
MRRPVEVPIRAEPRSTLYATRRGSYGRGARIAKVVLPLLALGLAGLIFAWSQINPIISRIPISETELAPEEIDTVTMENARFVGVDAEGRSYNVTADRAIQSTDDDQHIILQQPRADIVLADGTKIAIRSDTGGLQRDTRTLDLSGSVTLLQDGGYEFRTNKARIDLNGRTAAGDAIVEGHGPTGEIRADGFEITDRGERVVFRGRTRALFQPEPDRDAP